MLNLDRLKKSASLARREHDRALDDSRAERERGNLFRADMLEMDAHYALETAQAEEARLAEISRNASLIADFEREANVDFDCIGPIPYRCPDCGALCQFVHEHRHARAAVL